MPPHFHNSFYKKPFAQSSKTLSISKTRNGYKTASSGLGALAPLWNVGVVGVDFSRGFGQRKTVLF